MRTFYLSIFALLIQLSSLTGQDLAKGALKDALHGGSFGLQAIAQHNVVESKQVGFAGTESEQYRRFQEWYENASDREIYSATKHRNAVVRAYAYWALLLTRSPSAEDAWQDLSEDETIIKSMNGCIVEELSVARFVSRLRKSNAIGY